MGNGIGERIAYALGRTAAVVLVGGGISYYLIGVGIDIHAAKTGRITASPEQVGNYLVTREVWPRLTDWRKYFLVADRNGRIVTTAKSESDLVTIVDENSNNLIEGGDYVEVKNGKSTYRYHGNGTVTKGGEDKVEDKKITSKTGSILKTWNDVLKHYRQE